MTHFTLLTGGNADIKEDLVKVVADNGLTPCIKTISCNSTSVNTGRLGGANTRMELGHRLLWLICMLHTNELPLRHLVTELDGVTTGKVCFSAPIGKLCKIADILPSKSFEPISVDTTMKSIDKKVIFGKTYPMIKHCL